MIFILSEKAEKNLYHFLLLTKSNLGPIFHYFRNMVSFPLKRAHFSYPSSFNPEFEIISLVSPKFCMPMFMTQG